VTLTRHRRGEAREALLTATLFVVADGGVDAVTHRRVAAEAGVSPGSATHHFSSRDELIRAAFRFYLDQGGLLLGALSEATRSLPDPFERIGRILGGLLEQELAEVSLLRAEYELLLYASSDPELAADVRTWETRWVAFIADAFEEGGTPRPIEAARTVINLVRGFELERLLDDRLTASDFERRLELVLGPLR
jgi:AcrR family transcriptional regulator